MKAFPLKVEWEKEIAFPLFYLFSLLNMSYVPSILMKSKGFLIPHHKDSLFQYPNDFPLSNQDPCLCGWYHSDWNKRYDLNLSLEIFELYCTVSGAKLNLKKCTTSYLQTPFLKMNLSLALKLSIILFIFGIPFNTNGLDSFSLEWSHQQNGEENSSGQTHFSFNNWNGKHHQLLLSLSFYGILLLFFQSPKNRWIRFIM